jgi:5'(3')-deoxyribonucleotidase
MNQQEWLRFREAFSEERGAVHDDRNHRYAHDDDVLANFKRNAHGRLHPLEVWRTYAGKHWDALCSIVSDVAEGKSVTPSRGEDDILGSFYDLANYIEFGAALLSEKGGCSSVATRSDLPLIIVDLDDTLWDFVGECCSLVEGGIPDSYLYEWGGIYQYLGGRTPEVMESAASNMSFCEPFPGAVSAINSLFDNYRIGIVTSRYSGTLNSIRGWLYDNHIPSDFVLTGQKHKGEVARGMDAYLIIDDNLETLRDAANREIGAACLARTWNIDAEDDDRINRFSSWQEVENWLSSGH